MGLIQRKRSSRMENTLLPFGQLKMDNKPHAPRTTTGSQRGGIREGGGGGGEGGVDVGADREGHKVKEWMN